MVEVVNQKVYDELSNRLKAYIKNLSETEDIYNYCYYEEEDNGTLDRTPEEEAYEFGLQLESGASKIVIIDEDYDEYVLKIPIPYICYRWWNRDTEEYENDDSVCVLGNSYIQEEINIRNKYEDRFKPILEENVLVCNVTNETSEDIIPVYVQSKCYISYDYSSNLKNCSQRSITQGKKYADKTYFNRGWLTLVNDKYGRSWTDGWMKRILRKKDRTYKLYDMHSANYGIRLKDNMPVIIDYGGYNGFDA